MTETSQMNQVDQTNDRNDRNAAAQPYRNAPWMRRVEETKTPRWKQAIYVLARPVLRATAKRRLAPETIRRFRPESVLLERGFPLEPRRRWAVAGQSLANTTLLVQGTGTGWDVVGWAALRPKAIVATDLYAFESWPEIAAYCRERYGVPVHFEHAPLERHTFLPAGSVDVCVSDAVFEHCRHMDAVLAESRRVLRPGGTLYASYGPLWFCAGGDHFSGRGGLTHAYAHVEYGEAPYRAYFAEHLQRDEDFQSGGRYVELDLFSKWTTAEYLAAFDRAGFAREALRLETSALAVAFRRTFPERFHALCQRWAPRCTPDDFVLKANLVRLIRG